MTADRGDEANKRLLDRYNKMFHVNVKDHQDMSGILFCPLFDRAGDIGSLSVFRLLRPITQLKNTQSDLISGSLNRAISTNGSAYEFPTDDAWARILMRKHRTAPEWLLTVRATVGVDRPVSVHISEPGRVTVHVRACDSIYRAFLNAGLVTLMQCDEEGSACTKPSSVNARA